MEAAKIVKENGGKNDLIERIASDPIFGMKYEDLIKILAPKNFVGRAPQQVQEYIVGQVMPVIDANRDQLIGHTELNV
jgi:adenylosuccinate lyase